MVVVRDGLGLGAQRLALRDALDDRRALVAHRRRALHDAVAQALQRVGRDLPRRVLPRGGGRAAGGTRHAAEDAPGACDEAAAHAARHAPGRVLRGARAFLCKARAHDFGNVAIAPNQSIQLLFVLERLLARGRRAALPVDDRDLAALPRGERERVQEVAKRVAVGAPHLAELEQVSARDRDRLVDRGVSSQSIGWSASSGWRTGGSLTAAAIWPLSPLTSESHAARDLVERRRIVPSPSVRAVATSSERLARSLGPCGPWCRSSSPRASRTLRRAPRPLPAAGSSGARPASGPSPRAPDVRTTCV
jgi:hypothetical protein